MTIKIRSVDRYFYFWALVLPITSIVVFPSIQGTVPAYLLAIASIVISLLFSPQRFAELFMKLMGFWIVFILLNSIAQIGLSVTKADISDLRLVNAYDGVNLFRSSLITQSLYLIPAVFTFFFVRSYYQASWDKYILAGGCILAIYGFYEWSYYLVFEQSGDFLTNRVFDTGLKQSSASSFQTISLGGKSFLRFKSLTGEPSMYAFSMLPFWIYSVHLRRYIISAVFLVTLLLTTATTAILGILIYLLLQLFSKRFFFSFLKGHMEKKVLLVASFILLLTLLAGPFAADVWQRMVVDKLALGTVSGVQRASYFTSHMEFYWRESFIHKLFGIGFGYVRSTDFFSTLLVNMGVVGWSLFAALFAYPIVKLKSHSGRSQGLRHILIIIFILMMLAVSEFAYLPMWLFLGIAYNQLGKNAT